MAEMEDPQQTVWEILMEMERFSGTAKEEDQGALALFLDRAPLQLPKEDLASAVRVL